jgi:hypothetical protein
MDAWFPWFAGVTLLVQIGIVFTINAGVDSIVIASEAAFKILRETFTNSYAGRRPPTCSHPISRSQRYADGPSSAAF